FRTTDNLGSLLNPTSEQGVILGFGGGDTFTMSSSAGGQEVSTLAGFIKFIKTNVGANILSTPQIMALDNEEAEIEVGENVPVGTTSTATNGTASQGIDRQDATIKLNIKPFISPDSDTVKLVIDQKIAQVSNKKVIASELNNTAISLLKRALKTTIVVNDGDTAVLGGLMSDSVQETIKKVPVLGDLPILGWLFKSKKVDKIKQNLLLFITPKIIRSQEQSSDLLTQKIDERIDFLKDYMHGKDPHGKEMDNLPRYGKTSAAPVSASPSTSDDHLIDSTGSD
ncbi:MAG: type II secretion system protein GspD, partial [Bdellovibrionales bacterium]|nr:type II secretion system protein GspD [Bdellovibrionales bacterium]